MIRLYWLWDKERLPIYLETIENLTVKFCVQEIVRTIAFVHCVIILAIHNKSRQIDDTN